MLSVITSDKEGGCTQCPQKVNQKFFDRS